MAAVAVDHIVTGPADAPVVVLSNSLGLMYAMWDAQAAALAERFRVVRATTPVATVPHRFRTGCIRSTTSPTTSLPSSTPSVWSVRTSSASPSVE